jgi:hypothetical protein
LAPAEIRVFLNAFYDFEAPEKKNAQPGRKAASSPARAIGAFIGIHGQKCISKNSDLAWVEI